MQIGCDDVGCGEPVLLLHSSCSSKRQWHPIIKSLRDSFRIVAPDLLGYGDTDFPANPETFSIDDEVMLVESLLDKIETEIHVVGHSYGGVVALAVAMKFPERIRSLVLHEPVVFQLTRTEGLGCVAREIMDLSLVLQNKINNGRYVDAARVFLDYWQGEGSWVALPSRVQNELSRVISKLPLEFRAIFETPYLLKEYAQLKQPILVSAGTVGTPTAQKITKVLAEGIGSKKLRSLEKVGHLAPITHPSMMHSLILDHLKANPIAGFRK